MSWSDELHRCEVASLERCGCLQEVTKQVKRGPSPSPGDWKSPGTLLDRRSTVVLRVIDHHARHGDEAILGVRGVGVVDKQMRKEFYLCIRGVSVVAVLERPSV